MELLRREVELRKAPETLEAMQRAEESVDFEWMNVVEDLQHRIIQQYQTERNDSLPFEFADISVRDLRLAALRHPEIAFWVKNNRARQGSLKVGDVAPDVPLLRAIDGSLTSLLAQSSTDAANTEPSSRRTVVVAGSLS